MPIAPIFAQRSARDTDDIVALGMKSVRKLQGSMQYWMLREMRTGEQFDIRRFMMENLSPLLVNIQLAAHLSGFRRFRLTLKQSPSLMKRYNEGTLEHPALKTLELASANSPALNNAIKVLKSRVNIDIEELSAKYETKALQVLSDAGEHAERELTETLELLVARGAHLKESKETLQSVFDSLGLAPANSFSIENMFRTQTQLAFGAGKWHAEQDPDVQEILWGYKYVTVGDDRVRESHAALEGTTLPKDDPFWLLFYPPNGWSCRCQAIPIFEQVTVVRPTLVYPDGSPVTPDKGFAFNPGIVFAA